MPKQPASSNSESHLGALNIHHVGFEHYDGPAFEVRGLRDIPDYRWKVTDKRSNQFKMCSSLIEAVQFIERACMESKS